jgi:phosphoglycerate kinase
VGDGIELMVQSLKNGQVMLLENLQFHLGEKTNHPDFAHRLARLGQIFINDAFGIAHQKYASTYGLPSLLSTRGVGFIFEKELRFLDLLLQRPKKPFYAVIGGLKISNKLKALESLVRQADALLIGGAMSHAFWVAQGDTLPPQAKQPPLEDIEAARSILKETKRREIELLIPCDTKDGLDIGERTIEKFSHFLSRAKTIFWNGPLGCIEKPDYQKGTLAIAQAIAQCQAIKIAGGKDTVSVIQKAELVEQFDHLSTGGGGALFEYLEGNSLPGMEILKLKSREIFQNYPSQLASIKSENLREITL